MTIGFYKALKVEIEARQKLQRIQNMIAEEINVDPGVVTKTQRQVEDLTASTDEAFAGLDFNSQQEIAERFRAFIPQQDDPS